MQQSESVSSNVFVGDIRFDKEVAGFDLFNVEGIGSTRDRYVLLGKAVGHLSLEERRPFAQYTPSPQENLIVGHLSTKPRQEKYEVEGLTISYAGKTALHPNASGRRALTDLLNKSKANELRRSLWSAGGHSFYPKEGEDLDRKYPGCELTLFRGPTFRYNILSDGRIALALDSSTHYVKSVSVLEEIRRKGVDWLQNEIDTARKKQERGRRHFVGLHTFYELTKSDFAMEGIDKRPISSIKMSQPKVIGGVVCNTVSEFLRNQYKNNPRIPALDETQPGLTRGIFTFAPQFLYRTMDHESVGRNIQVEESFLMDDSPPGVRDDQRPATLRWQLISDYLTRYNFRTADAGPLQLQFTQPMVFPGSNNFEKPRLKARSPNPVWPEEIWRTLSGGMYQAPLIKDIFLYSVATREFSLGFYEELWQFAISSYGVVLPKMPILVERDLNKAKNQLQSWTRSNASKGAFFVGIIPLKGSLHNDLTNMVGELGIPSKCITDQVAEKVFVRGNKSPLKFTVASILARAGGIPWILHDKLHYDCYAAVDVGRSLGSSWAMSIVFSKDGSHTVRQGKITSGEALNEEGISQCLREANSYAPDSPSLIYLRDGEVFESERGFFESAIAGFPDYKDVAMVSVKKNVPQRIFRRVDGKMWKPLSGDYYFLDEHNAVVCAAGFDEYKQGMPKPVVLEVLPIRGEVDPKKVAEDAFRLSYLNWGSPGSSYSLPAPIRLAHELATELSSGIRRHGPPF